MLTNGGSSPYTSRISKEESLDQNMVLNIRDSILYANRDLESTPKEKLETKRYSAIIRVLLHSFACPPISPFPNDPHDC